MKFAAKNALSGSWPLLVVAAVAGALAGATATGFAAGNDGCVQSVTVRLDIEKAAAAALAAVPGSHIEGLELDYNGRTLIWEADTLARDDTERELHIDACDGRVLSNRIDPPEEGEDKPDEAKALRSAKITAIQAARAGAKAVSGIAAAVDFEYRRTRHFWGVDITADNGQEHKLRVDAATGKVTADTVEQDLHG
ncbi:PepSY domain-containing protein [Actinomadura sp. 6N118]|uniref:PepSY domain-containing protein n=1 Tax=Actinomadura sp. 6N118 TaxID=3375151 RepID=UPI0037A4C916